MTPRLALIPYRLPLHHPWRTAHGLRRERKGWLVEARCDRRSGTLGCALGQHGSVHVPPTDCCGYGDCCPLPEAGTESPRAAADRLAAWMRHFRSASLDTQLVALKCATPSSTPAADAALETALLDLFARLRGLPLRELLVRRLPSDLPPSVVPAPSSRRDPGARLSEQAKTAASESMTATIKMNLPMAEIEINAALGAVSDLQSAKIAWALEAGFRVLKVKVGVAPLDQELAAIRRCCEQLPIGARLRLDANRAWTLTRTCKLLDDLLPLASLIESLEEPCANVTDAQLCALQEQTPIAIALDESLPARSWPLDLEHFPVRRLVLKPGVIGGLRPTLALARCAQAKELEVVITSLIESAAGVWSGAQLAAATGSPLAHGLATSDWLAADLGAAPVIDAGRIRFPTTPGSGFAPVRIAPNVV